MKIIDLGRFSRSVTTSTVGPTPATAGLLVYEIVGVTLAVIISNFGTCPLNSPAPKLTARVKP